MSQGIAHAEPIAEFTLNDLASNTAEAVVGNLVQELQDGLQVHYAPTYTVTASDVYVDRRDNTVATITVRQAWRRRCVLTLQVLRRHPERLILSADGRSKLATALQSKAFQSAIASVPSLLWFVCAMWLAFRIVPEHWHESAQFLGGVGVIFGSILLLVLLYFALKDVPLFRWCYRLLVVPRRPHTVLAHGVHSVAVAWIERYLWHGPDMALAPSLEVRRLECTSWFARFRSDFFSFHAMPDLMTLFVLRRFPLRQARRFHQHTLKTLKDDLPAYLGADDLVKIKAIKQERRVTALHINRGWFRGCVLRVKWMPPGSKRLGVAVYSRSCLNQATEHSYTRSSRSPHQALHNVQHVYQSRVVQFRPFRIRMHDARERCDEYGVDVRRGMDCADAASRTRGGVWATVQFALSFPFLCLLWFLLAFALPGILPPVSRYLLPWIGRQSDQLAQQVHQRATAWIEEQF